MGVEPRQQQELAPVAQGEAGRPGPQELAPAVQGEAGRPGSVVSGSEMFDSSPCGL